MSTDVKTMNRKAFKAGMKKSHRIIYTHVQDILSSACERLLSDAVQSKEFQGFTGNTQTSYACGIYMDGKLAYCSFQESWNRPPVRLKVEKGKYVYLSHPYEGHARGVRGKTDVDSLYGSDTSLNFLKSYTNVPKKGFSIVMCTGTEYSEYIESSRNLNVLTETWQRARQILLQNLKPIPQ